MIRQTAHRSVQTIPSRSYQAHSCPGPTTMSLVRSAWYRLRSEVHTSELQSHLNLVCRLLLEKKEIYLREPEGFWMVVGNLQEMPRISCVRGGISVVASSHCVESLPCDPSSHDTYATPHQMSS